MRRIQRPRLTWPRRSPMSRLRLPRWRHVQTEKHRKSSLWKWIVRLARTLCVFSGTALAGATFWYGYDGYLDNKCMTQMQDWSNLVNLLDYCNQEGSDLVARGTACEKINRQALPEPPSCVGRGNTKPYLARPTIPPELASDLSVHHNVSRAAPTIQDHQRSGQLVTGGWDRSSPIVPTTTPVPSEHRSSGPYTTPEILVSRTLTVTGHFTVSPMPIQTLISVSNLPLPLPTSLYPATTHQEDIYFYCNARPRDGSDWEVLTTTTVHMELGDGQEPLHAQPTGDCDPGGGHVDTRPLALWAAALGVMLGTTLRALEDTMSDFLANRHVSPFPKADWPCATVAAPLFVLAYGLVLFFAARRYRRRSAIVVVDTKS